MYASFCKCTWLDTLCAFSLTIPRASSQSDTVQKQPPHFFGNREEVFYYNFAFKDIPSPRISDNRVVLSRTVQLARIHRARLFVLKPQEKTDEGSWPPVDEPLNAPCLFEQTRFMKTRLMKTHRFGFRRRWQQNLKGSVSAAAGFQGSSPVHGLDEFQLRVGVPSIFFSQSSFWQNLLLTR